MTHSRRLLQTLSFKQLTCVTTPRQHGRQSRLPAIFQTTALCQDSPFHLQHIRDALYSFRNTFRVSITRLKPGRASRRRSSRRRPPIVHRSSFITGCRRASCLSSSYFRPPGGRCSFLSAKHRLRAPVSRDFGRRMPAISSSPRVIAEHRAGVRHDDARSIAAVVSTSPGEGGCCRAPAPRCNDHHVATVALSP